jgi:hypothetical protein
MNMKKVWKVRNIKLWNSALHITLAVSVSEIMGYFTNLSKRQ